MKEEKKGEEAGATNESEDGDTWTTPVVMHNHSCKSHN